MQAKTILLILGAVTFSTIGQLFLKAGARQLAGLSPIEFLFVTLRNARVLSGLVAWLVSTLCWLYVLRVTPLSKAYGLTSLTYLMIPVASVLVLGEQVRRVHVAGSVLILLGVVCMIAGD